MGFLHLTENDMNNQSSTLVDLEKKFWQSMVDQDDAIAILSYRVKQGVAARDEGATTEQEMIDTSTWVGTGDGWRCAMHTVTPVAAH